jgi:hypothetical protein
MEGKLTSIIQRAKDQPEPSKPDRIKLLLLNVGVSSVDGHVRVELKGGSGRDSGFRLGDIGLVKEELTVEVGEIDGVKVDLEHTIGPNGGRGKGERPVRWELGRRREKGEDGGQAGKEEEEGRYDGDV